MVLVHRDPKADEAHTFGLQAHTLFKTTFCGQEDLASRPDHTMPWEPVAGAQCPDDLARSPGESRSVGHVPVSRYLAARDSAYLLQNCREHQSSHQLTVISDP